MLFLTPTAILLSGVTLADEPQAAGFRLYVGTELSAQETELDSGGFNTAGNFPNTGTVEEVGGAVGLKLGGEVGEALRFDLGYRKYENQRFTTGSFAPPNPTFFYGSKVELETLMVSAYYELLQTPNHSIYCGAGIGTSRTEVSTNDTVVSGSERDSFDFAWQVELGLDYNLTDSMRFNTGVRYTDLGKTKVDLNPIGGGGARG